MREAIVIGGGVGGLAVATLLARQGLAVELLEQHPEIAEVGAGLQISPNGLAVLRAMDLEKPLLAQGACRAKSVVLRDFQSGLDVARLPLDRMAASQRYYFVHRADLIAILLASARAAGVAIELNARVSKVSEEGDAALTMVCGAQKTADVIVAADGLHSIARPVLNAADAPFFTGQVAWRAVVKNRVGHPEEAHVTMGPGRHLVSYPIRGGDFVNLVAVEERDVWAAEGWQHPDDPAALRAAFASFQGVAAEMIKDVTDVSVWGLHRHPVATRWTGQALALLGDAAHPTLPFLAQGANMALEDAWVLADVVQKEGVIGIKSYQLRREARVRRVIATANKNAWRYHLHPGMFRTFAHAGLRMASRFAPGRMIGAFDWLYGYDVTRA
ncbi:MAG: FAD-dependent monooxygenase [Pseudomonadota bacterium]